ncbi:hypothetical protein HYC85_008592 [Camellia sinensis]|uniref:Regulator of chromosome condensation 1/beta-lactamase-inhibitor protein II n=1 Tax=Camellia sinensis TaxID=4442 RepID=A0A7J7HUI4_CAMSI|nr:hypothetical protein HYC85_008592 [Camellia sinensis]
MAEEKKVVKEAEAVKGGELLFCGATCWDTIGRRKGSMEGNLVSPTRLRPFVGVDIRMVLLVTVWHWMLKGVAILGGKGQLGHGDTIQRDRPTVVSELSKNKIIGAGAGRSHTVVVTNDGFSFAFGWNKHGQLGSGSAKSEIESSPVRCLVSEIKNAVCGADFTVWLSSVEGASILTAGLPQYGQLGHGTDNEYNTKDSSVRLAYEAQPRPKAIASLSGETIVKVACGTNHTVAVDSNGFVYTLGHREQKDEWAPRRVDVFTRNNVLPPNAVISAGSVNSSCTAGGGQLYMWGKIKNSGDDWMYPKPLMDLSFFLNISNIYSKLGCFRFCSTRGVELTPSPCKNLSLASNSTPKSGTQDLHCNSLIEIAITSSGVCSQLLRVAGIYVAWIQAACTILLFLHKLGSLRSLGSWDMDLMDRIPKKVDTLEGMHVIRLVFDMHMHNILCLKYSLGAIYSIVLHVDLPIPWWWLTERMLVTDLIRLKFYHCHHTTTTTTSTTITLTSTTTPPSPRPPPPPPSILGVGSVEPEAKSSVAKKNTKKGAVKTSENSTKRKKSKDSSESEDEEEDSDDDDDDDDDDSEGQVNGQEDQKSQRGGKAGRGRGKAGGRGRGRPSNEKKSTQSTQAKGKLAKRGRPKK